MKNQFGIYEKALPPVPWVKKFALAQKYQFDFIELSIDESEVRLARLEWTEKEITEINFLQAKTGVKIRSICFSAQRKYPLGSLDKQIQDYSLQLLEQCIQLAVKLGVRIIQLAGYDVYYEQKTDVTAANFLKNLQKGLAIANRYGVMLALETMDDPFLNTITKYLILKKAVPSPWLAVYPDLGNLSAWCGKNVISELELGLTEIVGLHVKDTIAVTKSSPGKFKKVPFGSGCVDFIKIFQFLKANNYQGSFMLEAWYEDDPDSESALAAAVSFVRQQFTKGGW
ncbi:L-ribulose-5-phosphate 3-epimerase [Spiroplasma sp. SV19]|uniref:L-ribulose-5-phosphate 3-epimerase n=1 Tax=Spiroplasma sp. SV19 TaxID=2570468 RepID=UPI0024B65459|nr:L-ribulose-5-phosphate 3-epimerase [Spiroplasma sp. SV19]WHQ37116.1 L-ribulose-5-phosphate 3-epimerase [Spiroplasma sp. SV19]